MITSSTPLADATKCVLVSFDLTMRSNLSAGMPIDLIGYKIDNLDVHRRRRLDVRMLVLPRSTAIGATG